MKGFTDIVPVLSSPVQVYSHLWFIRYEQLHELFSLCYHEKWVRNPLLPPATKLRQGNVFTRVCGVSVRETLMDRDPPPKHQTKTHPGQGPPWTENPPVWTETPRMDRDPPGQRPPGRNRPPYGNECASYWNAFLLNFSIHAKVWMRLLSTVQPLFS